VKSLVLHFGRPYRTIGADRLPASKQYPADGGDGERGSAPLRLAAANVATFATPIRLRNQRLKRRRDSGATKP
jgi:hypothetical protein